jgi:hypothetical protein
MKRPQKCSTTWNGHLVLNQGWYNLVRWHLATKFNESQGDYTLNIPFFGSNGHYL